VRFLPIVERELRRATRQPRTYWARVTASTLAAVAAIVSFQSLSTWTAAASNGRALFGLISAMAFWSCLFAGVFTTALPLVDEKKQGTLGLLLLTPLRAYDIVVGKMAAVSLNLVQVLMGILPVMASCLILGGVSVAEFWRMVAVLFGTLFFSLAAGMFISAISRRTGRSMAGTAALLVLIPGVLAQVDILFFEDLRRLETGFLVPGPYQAYQLVWDERYELPPHGFWSAVGFTLFVASSLLALASAILPRTVCETSNGRRNATKPSSIRWAAEGTSEGSRARRGLLHRNPILWLTTRRPGPWLYLWGFFLLAVVLWIGGLFSFGFYGRQFSFAISLSLAPVLYVTACVAIACASANRFAEGRRNGELELLLATPLSIRKICDGHMLGLVRQFALPLVFVLSVHLILLVVGIVALGERGDGAVIRLLMLVALGVMLVVNVRTLAWVGLWEGLRSSSVYVAIRRTLLLVLVLPSLVFLLTLAVSPTLYLFGGSLRGTSGWMLGAVIWWCATGFMVNYASGLHAERKLRDQFRRVVSERVFHPVRHRRSHRRSSHVMLEQLLLTRRAGW
jgi:ABC-type Na+ efflux pump permease subunit